LADSGHFPLAGNASEVAASDGSMVFVPGANGVTVRVSVDPESDNPVDMRCQGWQAILDNFAKYVHANQSESDELAGGVIRRPVVAVKPSPSSSRRG
jgi:hypothetical protein